MDNQPITTFTTMHYNNRHLVIKTTAGKSAAVLAECYLEQNAVLICRLLTDHAENKNGEVK